METETEKSRIPEDQPMSPEDASDSPGEWTIIVPSSEKPPQATHPKAKLTFSISQKSPEEVSACGY